MHRSEIHLLPCAGCGAPIDPGDARSYSFGDDALEAECVVGRGGSYDADTERWVSAPRVSDVAREER